jgi:hypothetical protein
MKRYFRMLDVGVPAKAVTHKMAADGIDDAWVRIFVAGSGGGGGAGAADATAAGKKDGGATSLSAALAAGIKGRGKPPLQPLLGRGSSGGLGSVNATTTSSSTSLKLRPVHFEQLAPGRAEKSVFLRRRSSHQPPSPAEPSMAATTPLSSSPGRTGGSAALVAVAGRGGVQGQTVKELAELFSVTPRPRPGAAAGGGVMGGRRGPVFGAALDSRRLQNVGIVYTCTY